MTKSRCQNSAKSWSSRVCLSAELLQQMWIKESFFLVRTLQKLYYARSVLNDRNCFCFKHSTYGQVQMRHKKHAVAVKQTSPFNYERNLRLLTAMTKS